MPAVNDRPWQRAVRTEGVPVERARTRWAIEAGEARRAAQVSEGDVGALTGLARGLEALVILAGGRLRSDRTEAWRDGVVVHLRRRDGARVHGADRGELVLTEFAAHMQLIALEDAWAAWRGEDSSVACLVEGSCNGI